MRKDKSYERNPINVVEYAQLPATGALAVDTTVNIPLNADVVQITGMPLVASKTHAFVLPNVSEAAGKTVSVYLGTDGNAGSSAKVQVKVGLDAFLQGTSGVLREWTAEGKYGVYHCDGYAWHELTQG